MPCLVALRASGVWLFETNADQTWCTFPQDSGYFNPSAKPFMINYGVENIVVLVEQLKQDNVTLIDEIAEYDYGKFVHVLDPEGNILELWEPTDAPDQADATE
jgi:lactoylglutathione lyase